MPRISERSVCRSCAQAATSTRGSGSISMRWCCTGSRGRTTRRKCSGRRAEAGVEARSWRAKVGDVAGYVPAKVKLAEALFDNGDVEKSARRMRRAGEGTGGRDRSGSSGWDAWPRRRGVMRRRRVISSGQLRCFRSSARRITRSPVRRGRSGRSTSRSVRWSAISNSARDGRRSTIRCWRRSRQSGRTRAHRCGAA